MKVSLRCLFPCSLVLILLPLLLTPPRSFAGECQWSKVYRGDSGKLRAFPDQNANYWAFSFKADESTEHLGFKIEGDYPHARYFSFNFYDAYDGALLMGISDEEIQPEPGQENPFRAGANRDSEQRRYAVWFSTSRGFLKISRPSREAPNRVALPSDTRRPTVMLRVYRVDKGMPRSGGSLPRITAVDLDTGLETECPKNRRLWPPKGFLSVMREVRSYRPERQPRFFHLDGHGLYPCLHNLYLGTRLTPKKYGDVAILKVHAPTFVKSYDRVWEQPKEAEVRYWSVCMGNARTTTTSGCVTDDESRLDKEGFAWVVIGPKDEKINRKAITLGAGFLTWGSRSPVALYRQMLPARNYAGSVEKVPLARPDDLEGKEARKWLEEDAPRAGYCSRENFLARGLDCMRGVDLWK